MNILHIMGFLGADPEERFTPSGQKLWVLRVATRTRKNGQEETIWWRVTVWGDQYDKMLSYFKKGKPIYIVAEMNKLDVYTDKNGQPQVSYDAVARSLHFIPMNDRQDQQQGQQQGQQYGQQQGGGYSAPQQQHQSGSQFQQNDGGAHQQQHQSQDFSASMTPAYGSAGDSQDFSNDEDPVPF